MVGKVLLSDTLFFSRTPGLLADAIIDLLEYNSLSDKEISDFTGADKGQVSKVIKGLLAEKLITLSDFSGNSRYYTTNCDNCPYGREKDGCFAVTKEFIKNTLKNELKIKTVDSKFKEFDRHSLRNMEKMLKLNFVDSNMLQNDLTKLQSLIFNNIITELDKKSPSEARQFLPSLPTAYQIGLEHGLAVASKIQMGMISRVLKPLLKGAEFKRFVNRYIQQTNKFAKITNV